MNLEKIHLIKSKDMCLSYYYPTADIRVINKETYDILSALKEYKDIHEALELYRDEEQVVSLIRSIYASNKGEHSTNIQNGSKRKVIKRITLHTARHHLLSYSLKISSLYEYLYKIGNDLETSKVL